MKEENTDKMPLPRLEEARLGQAVACFAAFMAVGLGAYYIKVGEFVSANLASLYALLALVGAAAVMLGLWRFVAFYYAGCALAWVCGGYVGGLEGEFAPTAGALTTGFLIAVFALLGLVLQWRTLRKKWLLLQEEKAREEAEGQKEAPAAAAEAVSAPSGGEDPSA